MNPTVVGIIGTGVLLLLLFAGMPVGIAMAVVGYAGICYLVSPGAAGNILFTDVFGTFNSYEYSVIPLFIFMGAIMTYAGTSRKLYDAAYKWLGHFPGGLAIASIGACAGFAAICGSALATIATIGKVAMPEMKKYNYAPELSTGCIVAGGVLGPLIPPSVVFIIYGVLTEQSIIKLFYAGIFPGLLLTALLMICVYCLVRLNPSWAPPAPRISFKDKIKSLSEVVDIFILFALIMGGLFAGWFTTTEAAAVGSGAAILIGLVRRGLSRKDFIKCVMETVLLTATLIVIITGAFIFNRFLALTQIPFILADWVKGLAMPPMVIISVILIFFIIGGCFVDVMPLMILTIPVFYPVIVSLGFSPILYGVIIEILMGVGAITPPVGIGVYTMKAVAVDVPIDKIFKGSIPFIIAMIVCVIILLAFPKITLFLPGLL